MTGRTEGNRLTVAALKALDWTQDDLVSKLAERGHPVTRQSVSLWCGRGKPKPAIMHELEELLGVPMNAWLRVANGEHR